MVIDWTYAAWLTLTVSAGIYSAVGMAFVFGLLRRPKPATPAGQGSPLTDEASFVSVVIAARNEESVLPACLERLCRQTFSGDRYEVLVVDDNSTDTTRNVIQSFARNHPNIRVLVTGDAFPDLTAKKRPMAVGIAQARGAIILTTDADCRVPSTWVEAMAELFQDDVGIVIGYSQLKGSGSRMSWFERLQGLDFLALMSAAAGSARLGFPLAVSGQNFAYRKSLYERVDGFTTVGHRASGDDVLLLQLMRRCGGVRAVFTDDPKTRVSTWRSESPSGFLQQRRRWASNAGLQLKLNPAFFVYLLAVFSLSVLVPLGLVFESLRPAALAALAAKTTIDLAVVTLGAIRFGRRDLVPMFPLWQLLQMPHIVLVGVAGTLAGFTWRGTRYPLRRSALAGRTP